MTCLLWETTKVSPIMPEQQKQGCLQGREPERVGVSSEPYNAAAPVASMSQHFQQKSLKPKRLGVFFIMLFLDKILCHGPMQWIVFTSILCIQRGMVSCYNHGEFHFSALCSFVCQTEEKFWGLKFQTPKALVPCLTLLLLKLLFGPLATGW